MLREKLANTEANLTVQLASTEELTSTLSQLRAELESNQTEKYVYRGVARLALDSASSSPILSWNGCISVVCAV